jgi:hypothetical protein
MTMISDRATRFRMLLESWTNDPHIMGILEGEFAALESENKKLLEELEEIAEIVKGYCYKRSS